MTANIILISQQIIGLKKCIKLCHLANDMIIFLADNSSVRYSLRVSEEFYLYARLKLNKDKTKEIIIQIGGNSECNLSLEIKRINRSF